MGMVENLIIARHIKTLLTWIYRNTTYLVRYKGLDVRN
jgi:hypothetical protein